MPTLQFVADAGRRPRLLLEGMVTPALHDFLEGIPGVQVRRGQILLPAELRLVELVQVRVPGVVLGEKVKEWLAKRTEEEARATALKQLPDAPLDSLAEKLWPFQRVGVNFLLRQQRTMLCDEPGLGKTAMAITAVRLTMWHNRVLVLCPNSLKGWWRSEIERWHPGATVHVVEAGQMRCTAWFEWKLSGGYLIVNWEALRLMPEVRSQPWQWVICDEAHRTKNRKTKIFECLSEIQAIRMVLVTATPFANEPGELWTLLHLLNPQRYPSYWRFFEMYTEYQVSWGGYREMRGVRNPELLARELAPVMIRRHKLEVLADLPPKVYTDVPLELGGRQKELYIDMAKRMAVELESGEELQAVNALSQLLRLRQILSTTATIDDSDVSCKLDAVVDMIEDAGPNVPFVVFTQFRRTVEKLCARLKAEGITYQWIMGGLGSEEVSKRVEAFQQGSGQVFVATLGTGGVGITLTRAYNLVFIEKHYNPATQEQAEDRIHRIGQRNAAQIISLRVPKSADDVVEDILQRKVTMVEAVLKQALLRNLTDYLAKEGTSYDKPRGALLEPRS